LNTLRYYVVFILLTSMCCGHNEQGVPEIAKHQDQIENSEPTKEYYNKATDGALLLTRFKSLDDFKTIVQVQYYGDTSGTKRIIGNNPFVLLTYHCGNINITSSLKAGINQSDLVQAKKGNLWDQIVLVLKYPYVLLYKRDLVSVENLGRRRPWTFGLGDVAYYDIAETTVSHIVYEDRIKMSAEDLSEKGYLNTFNHITAQALMSSMFSEGLADFVADVHERFNMPELVTGKFKEAQLDDFENGPVDNYVDMLNNEWGQILGQKLKKKYSINRNTSWTPELLANYLNDIQGYYSWVFQIGFTPFRSTDDKVIQFAKKINTVRKDS